MSLPYLALVEENHTHVAQVGEGEKGEQENRSPDEGAGALEEENLEQILKTKVASGVDQEPRSKQNSLRCQEFHAL